MGANSVVDEDLAFDYTCPFRGQFQKFLPKKFDKEFNKDGFLQQNPNEFLIGNFLISCGTLNPAQDHNFSSILLNFEIKDGFQDLEA